ncbi:MAG TPA: hypothetical protein VIC53_04145, partial [Wenzhouxiangella sp.]
MNSIAFTTGPWRLAHLKRQWIVCFFMATLLTTLVPNSNAWARPVTYTGGKVVIADVQPNMKAWRYGYSPSFRWSTSVGGLYLDDLADRP